MSPSSVFCSLARHLRPVTTAFVVLSVAVTVGAQIPGRNVNMVSGTDWPGGDPFLQRQNEPSMAASTRNPLHLVAGSNDYRTVDLPGLPDDVETGDAWVSVYKSFDGGQRWASTLMPGYPQDTSAVGMASPLKGYQAAADPVVRAGTHGLIYYNGLVFNRGDNGRSGIFLARFIDKNNKENGDPVEYLGASMVATSDGTTFLDKPWMAVDIPRGNSGFCAVGVAPASAADDDDDEHGHGGKVKRNGHRKRGRDDDRRRGNQPPNDGNLYVPAGAVYVAYTAITGEGATLQSQIYVKRSMDCGATWSAPMRVTSTADAINQGATLAISPTSGDLFVTWRRFSPPNVTTADAVMVTRLKVNGNSCDAPGKAWGLRRTGPDNESERIFEHRKKRATPATAASVAQIDQSTSPYKFRTNAYPAMTVDGAGRAYIAWSERGYATPRSSPDDGDARIRVTTTLDGKTFTAPVLADSPAGLLGHQLMPSLAFAGGKLLLVYYDLRDTRASVFGPFVDDSLASPVNKRQTIDIRAALGTPGAVPVFAPSVPVSDYLTGFRNGSSQLEKLQVNPPNLPMFRLGTVPFIGDYIDIAPSPAFVPLAGGGWGYNTAATSQFPVFHAVWTDNRDVRPPLNGNWANYAPPGLAGGGTSLFDPTKSVQVCRAGNAGSRNQNIYTARISGGLVVGAPGNAKQLSPTVQRGFVVFAQNQATVTKTFRMTILSQPQGAPLSGRASFEQFPLPPYTATSLAPKTFVDVKVPPRSTASRTVYATSTDPKAQISIDVSEIGAVGGSVVSGGLAGRAVLNPDIENPDIENPDIENPDIENPDIENAEVYNPDIENPDIENPDIENPDIENPDIENPDIENVRVANPDIENIGVGNPDIENPDIENPDIENPDIENPDIENGVISDVTWTVTNIGNTTSAFNTNMFLASATVPTGIKTQLIVYKTYKTPVLASNGCDLKTETRNILLFNVPSPNFITPGEGLPDQNDPSDTNATLWLNPGEVGRVTLRVYDPNKHDNIIVTNLDGTTASIDPRFNPATVVTAAISAQGVDVLDPIGATEPPAVTTTGTNLFFLEQPSNVAPTVPMAPPVLVRVWDNTGAPLVSVDVNLALCGAPNPLQPANPCPAPPAGVSLSGATAAVANGDGIAAFATLSVNLPATGLRLRATVTTLASGVVAAGTSAPFNVQSSTVAVAIQNPGFEILYKPGSTTVTALPFTSSTSIIGTSNLGMTTDPAGLFRQFSDGSSGTSFDLAGWTFSTLMGVAYLGETVLGPGHGNVAWFNGPGFGGGTAGKSMSQTLGENLQQGLTYTLTADFGWRTDNEIATTPPVLNLYAGGTLLVPIAQVNPTLVKGMLVTYARTYLVNNPLILGSLKVEVGLGPNTVGQQLNVDNVTLQKVTPGMVFVPGTAGGPGGTPPVDSGFVLALGETVTLTASGVVTYCGPGCGALPGGAENGRLDNLVPVANWSAPTASLMARVGTGAWQFVGGGPTTVYAYEAGMLQLAVNDSNYADNGGGWNVSIAQPALPNAVVTLSGFSAVYNGTPKSIGYATTPGGLGVDVRYNGAGSPSAIGAYFTRASVTGGVYAGAATATFKVASTLAAGGGGGGPYERYCGSGVFAKGFSTNNFSSYGLLNAQLECETGGPTERFVLDNNNSMNQTSTCGPTEVMVGFHGLQGLSDVTAGPFVKSLGARCQDRTGVGPISTIPAVGIGGDPFGPFDCPTGQAVTGVVGGAGSVLDSVALVCGTLP